MEELITREDAVELCKKPVFHTQITDINNAIRTVAVAGGRNTTVIVNVPREGLIQLKTLLTEKGFGVHSSRSDIGVYLTVKW